MIEKQIHVVPVQDAMKHLSGLDHRPASHITVHAQDHRVWINDRYMYRYIYKDEVKKFSCPYS